MLIMENEVETQALKKQEKTSEVAVIILLYKSPDFKGFPKPFDLEMYGKKMWKYVELACSDYPIKTTTCTNETDILGLIKPMLTNSKYTLVLYSDTPLIKKSTVKKIVELGMGKDVNVMKLIRGFFFNTEYIRQADSIISTIIEKVEEEDFLSAYDNTHFGKVCAVMKKRIQDFHIKNGVLIKDTNLVFIDSDVIIESGVVIEHSNLIKGQTYIGKNTILESGNYIKNSIIKDNCVITLSYLENVKIESGQVLTQVNKRME